MWTSHKDTHDPSFGKAKNLTIGKTSGILTYYMESSLSFWIKWSRDREDDKFKQAMLNYANDIEYFMIEQKEITNG